MNDKIFYFILLALLFITFKVVWDYVVVEVMRRDLERKLIKINIEINEYSKKNKVNDNVCNFLNDYIHRVESCINELSLTSFILTKIFINKKYRESEKHIKSIVDNMDDDLKEKFVDINTSIGGYVIRRSSVLMILFISISVPLIILIVPLMILDILSEAKLKWGIKRETEKVIKLLDMEQVINCRYNGNIKAY